jgi:hypothetical protein
MTDAYEAAKRRYLAAVHAMQTGVKMLAHRQNPSGGPVPDEAETSPKHLRVGVNSALLDSGALAALLIEKGIITAEEHVAKLAELAEADVASYKARLGLPPNVHLG